MNLLLSESKTITCFSEIKTTSGYAKVSRSAPSSHLNSKRCYLTQKSWKTQLHSHSNLILRLLSRRKGVIKKSLRLLCKKQAEMPYNLVCKHPVRVQVKTPLTTNSSITILPVLMPQKIQTPSRLLNLNQCRRNCSQILKTKVVPSLTTKKDSQNSKSKKQGERNPTKLFSKKIWKIFRTLLFPSSYSKNLTIKILVS